METNEQGYDARTQAMLDAVKAFAEANPNKRGWDIVINAMDDEQIVAIFTATDYTYVTKRDGTVQTMEWVPARIPASAIKKVDRAVRAMADHYDEMTAEARQEREAAAAADAAEVVPTPATVARKRRARKAPAADAA